MNLDKYDKFMKGAEQPASTPDFGLTDREAQNRARQADGFRQMADMQRARDTMGVGLSNGEQARRVAGYNHLDRMQAQMDLEKQKEMHRTFLAGQDIAGQTARAQVAADAGKYGADQQLAGTQAQAGADMFGTLGNVIGGWLRNKGIQISEDATTHRQDQMIGQAGQVLDPGGNALGYTDARGDFTPTPAQQTPKAAQVEDKGSYFQITQPDGKVQIKEKRGGGLAGIFGGGNSGSDTSVQSAPTNAPSAAPAAAPVAPEVAAPPPAQNPQGRSVINQTALKAFMEAGFTDAQIQQLQSRYEELGVADGGRLWGRPIGGGKPRWLSVPAPVAGQS